MKKYFVTVVALLLFAGCFSSFKKECVCTVSSTTPTTSNKKTYEMGKMDEKDCLKYTDNVVDGDGVSRILNCQIKKSKE